MSRKTDLEEHMRASYDLIREYEAIIQTSSEPKEKARARRAIQEQWSLIEAYLAEYRRLASGAFPTDIAEIAAYFEGNEPGQVAPAPTTPPSPPSGPTYVTHIQHGQGIAIGDGARVEVSSGDRPPRGLEPSGGVAWNTDALRDLLLAAFDDRGLTVFCFDSFREVYEGFTAGINKGQKSRRLVDDCLRAERVEELLAHVKEWNPAQYSRFEGQLRK